MLAWFPINVNCQELQAGKEVRLQQGGFEESCRLEEFDWTVSIILDRRLLDAAFFVEVLAKREQVPVLRRGGRGKGFLAQALGYSDVKAVHTVRFSEADDCFRVMNQGRVNNSLERIFRSFLVPDPLILDDWQGLAIG